MADASSAVQHFPPFPPLTWSKYSWEGETLLASWRGFQARRGSYGAVSSAKASDGTVHLHVGSLNDQEQLPPTPEQAAAFAWLLAHESAVQSAILDAIFKSYPKMRASYGYDESDETMPPITSPEELKPLLGLGTVHVLTVTKDGLAYLGFEFGCTWDDEHGLGVMTHKGRVIEVGGADTSFLEWIAEADADLP